MAIGIGLHCWYCEHGPCNGECQNDKMVATSIKTVAQKRDEKIDIITDTKFKNDSERIYELKACLKESLRLLQNAEQMEDVYDMVRTMIRDTLNNYEKDKKFITLK